MTSLLDRMTEDMEVHNLAATTQTSYRLQVTQFARYFHKPIDDLEQLTFQDIRAYQVHLTREKNLAPNSIGVAVCALRFLYKYTLHKDWNFDTVIPAPRSPRTLPVVLSPVEVERFLDAIPHLRDRTILTICYAAGLRVSEAVNLKIGDIDSQRMVLRVDQGKGRRDRYVMLSPKLLEMLRKWWRQLRPPQLLFPGEHPDQAISVHTVQLAAKRARAASGIAKPITPHSMRHAFAVHLLESGVDVRTIQLLLGHRSLATTAQYLRIAANKVCAAVSPFDRLGSPQSTEVKTEATR